MQVDWPRFVDEARRVHDRYLVEVVEAFGLCPWARDARIKGRIHVHVTPVTTADPQLLLREVDVCMHASGIEIGMLLCPLLALSPKQLRHLTAEVRALEEQRRPRGETQIAFADFHPIAVPDLTTAERLVPFLRRSPDPMLQIVRTDVLARVRRSQESSGTSYVDPARLGSLALDQLHVPAPSLAERVAQANMNAVQHAGVAALEAVLRDIHADRNRSYAELGVSAPTHAHIGDIANETAFASDGNRDEKPESKAGYSCASDKSYIDPS
jgi:hypothetical protein